MSTTVEYIREWYALPMAGADDVIKLISVLSSIRTANLGEDPREVADGLADLLWRWLREKVGVVCDYSTGVFDTPEGPVVRVWLRYKRFPHVYETIVYILVTRDAVMQDGVVHLKGLGLTCDNVLGALEWALFAPIERLRRWWRRRRAKCEFDVGPVKARMATDVGRAVAERVGKYACEVGSVEEVLYLLLNELRIDATGALFEDHVERPRDVAKDVARAVGVWLLKLWDLGILDAAYERVRDNCAIVELWYSDKYVEVKICVDKDGLKPRLSRVCRGRDLGGPFC